MKVKAGTEGLVEIATWLVLEKERMANYRKSRESLLNKAKPDTSKS